MYIHKVRTVKSQEHKCDPFLNSKERMSKFREKEKQCALRPIILLWQTDLLLLNSQVGEQGKSEAELKKYLMI